MPRMRVSEQRDGCLFWVYSLIIIEIVWGVYNIIFIPLVELSSSQFLAILHIVIVTLFIILSGILGIVLGVYLLGTREDKSGLFRIYAILYIVSSSCAVTVILVPITMLLVPVEAVILAILFFRAAGAEPKVEFV